MPSLIIHDVSETTLKKFRKGYEKAGITRQEHIRQLVDHNCGVAEAVRAAKTQAAIVKRKS